MVVSYFTGIQGAQHCHQQSVRGGAEILSPSFTGLCQPPVNYVHCPTVSTGGSGIGILTTHYYAVLWSCYAVVLDYHL